MTQTTLNDSFEIRDTTVGKEYPFTEVRILDPERRRMSGWHAGEFCCRGYLVIGIFKIRATAEVIDKNGFLHSGDLGIKRRNGYYRVTDESDMIIRGEKMSSPEIEEFLI